jgi:hypothetical protein
MPEDLPTPRVGDVWRFTFVDGCVTDILVTRTDRYPEYPGEDFYEPPGFRDLFARKDVPNRVLLYRLPDEHYREKP